jgi:hypothetical protein
MRRLHVRMLLLYRGSCVGASRKQNEEAKAAGNQVKYFYRHLYCPEKGMFCTIPDSMVQISGNFIEVYISGF